VITFPICSLYQLLQQPSWGGTGAQLELNTHFTMLRTTIPRTLLRPLTTAPAKAARAQFQFKPTVSESVQLTSRLCTLSSKRPQAIAISIQKLNRTTLRSSSKYDKPDTKLEAKVGKKKLEAHPELVSTTSSTHPLFSEIGTPEPEKDTDMSAGIMADVVSESTSLVSMDTNLAIRKLSKILSTFPRFHDRHIGWAWQVSCLTSRLLSRRLESHRRSISHMSREQVI